MKLVNFFKAALTMLTIIVAASCTDLAGIEDRLDSLESDVKALQGQLAAVNQNFETLESLKGAIVISDVEEIQNGYKLTLSNGEVLNLTLVVDEPKEEKPEILGAIEINQNEVKITLADGTVVSVPVVENFKFAIKLNGEVVTEKQEFTKGETVEYDVEQSNVASAAVVACPDGFSVELQENKLIVSTVITFDVNSTPATKATASSENEIAILAVSKNGHSVLSKLQVSAKIAEDGEDEGDDTPDTPSTSGVTLANATHECYDFNSVKLNVTFVEATKLYYTILNASETVPDTEALKAANAYEKPEEGDAVLSESNLTPATNYKVYYITTSDDTTYSSVQEFTFSTRAVNENNLYELYVTDQDIIVGGITINKTNYPEATYICRGTNTRGVPKNGLCFVEAHDEIAANFNSGINNLIVIGTNPAKRSIVNREGISYISAVEEDGANEVFVMANIKYTDTTNSAESFKFNKAYDFKTITFENCQFSIPASAKLIVTNGKTFTDFSMTGCDVKFETGATIITSGTSNVKHGTVYYENNVFYSDVATANVFLVDGTSHSADMVTLKSNTLYNIAATKNVGFVRVKNLTSISIKDNLFYNCQGTEAHSFIYYNTQTTPEKAEASHNVSSTPQDANYKVYIVNGSSPAGVTNPDPTNYAFPLGNWDPANGSFKIDGTYKEDYYGAQR